MKVLFILVVLVTDRTLDKTRLGNDSRGEVGHATARLNNK